MNTQNFENHQAENLNTSVMSSENSNDFNQVQSNEVNNNQSQSNTIQNTMPIQMQESNVSSNDDGNVDYSVDSNNINNAESQKVVIEEPSENQKEENRLEKLKQSPYFKKLNGMLEKLNEVKHIKIDCIFENIKDAHTIFSLERRTYDFVINLNKILIGVVIVQFLLIMSLFPLKEKEPYLVGFSNATQNFVHIEPANKRISANDSLVRSLVGAYILNRETINRFDDSQRYEVVRLQSTMKVWKIFENLVAQEKSIYSNESLERVVKIVNITKIKNGYINAEIQVALFNLGNLQSQKRYRISLMYQFRDLEIDFKSLPKNPTGFQVTEYSVTEIATIKELNEENKVNPSSVNSRIKQKEVNRSNGLDSNEFLRDNYQYQDSSFYNDPTKSPMEFQTESKNDLDSIYNSSTKQRKEINEEIKKLKEMEKMMAQEKNQQKEENKPNQQNSNNTNAPSSNMPNPFE